MAKKLSDWYNPFGKVQKQQAAAKPKADKTPAKKPTTVPIDWSKRVKEQEAAREAAKKATAAKTTTKRKKT